MLLFSSIILFPRLNVCEHSENREGYYHLTDFNGSVTTTQLKYLIRDFDMIEFQNRKAFMKRAADYLNATYGMGTVDIEIEDSYFSMYEVINRVQRFLNMLSRLLLTLA